MASKKDPYETMTLKILGSRKRKVEKLVRKGWEIVSTTHLGLSGITVYTLRRPNPKYVG